MRYFLFLRNFLWVMPFVAFFAGYQVIYFIAYRTSFTAPCVVGQHIHDAISQLSGYQLNARILSQKEDIDLPEGIVVSQVPLAGQKIKAQQSVFLVVNRHPARPKAPDLYNISLLEAQKKIRKNNIYLKTYFIESNTPENSCIAQNIQPGKEMPGSELLVYCSTGLSTLRIMPDLKNIPVDQVIEFFNIQNINYTIAHQGTQDATYTGKSGKVSAQRPLAGSVIDLKKPVPVQITVS